MTSRALIRDVVNQGIFLETENAEIARKSIANARNKIKAHLDKNPELWNKPNLGGILDTYLDEVDAKIGVEKALNQGISDGKTFVGDSARIPTGSAFYGWTPSIPLGAISLAESEMANLIRKTSQQLKEKTLRMVQTGIAAGASIGQMQADILGLGIRGTKGKDGVFRSATARAEMQARTITNDLINRGAMITYNEVDSLAPELGIKKIWQTVSDRRTSARCISLNGQIRGLKELFMASDGWQGSNPPSHPNCRSRVTCLTEKYKKEWEDRWPQDSKGEIPKAKNFLNLRSIKATNINPTISQMEENSVKFMNPLYDVNSLNSAFNQLALEDPELGKRIDAVLKFQKQEKISLLFHDSNYSGQDNLEQILEFNKYLNSRKSVNPLHLPASTYGSGEKAKIWLTLQKETRRGHTGKEAPFILLRTDQLQNKQLSFNANNIKKSLRRGTARQKLLSEKIAGGKIGPNETFDYLVGNSYTFGPNGEHHPGTLLLNTYIHEVGHQVQYKAARYIPGNMHSPSNIGIEETFTRYAMLNDREKFAEGFVWYTVDPETMKNQVPNYYNWIDSLWKLSQ
jgi:Phage Mu protein F like protein